MYKDEFLDGVRAGVARKLDCDVTAGVDQTTGGVFALTLRCGNNEYSSPSAAHAATR